MAGHPGTKHATFAQKMKAHHELHKRLTQPNLPADKRWRYPDNQNDATLAAELGCAQSAVSAVRNEFFPEGFITQMPPRAKTFRMPAIAGEPIVDETVYANVLERLLTSPSLEAHIQQIVNKTLDMATAPAGHAGLAHMLSSM